MLVHYIVWLSLLSLFVCGDVSSLLCDVVVALYCLCVGGMLVHCYVMDLLLSLYVCVGGDVSSLSCDAVVALTVCVDGDVSSLFCDVVVALIVCVCWWGCLFIVM